LFFSVSYQVPVWSCEMGKEKGAKSRIEDRE
jgi:hypothetical protein